MSMIIQEVMINDPGQFSDLKICNPECFHTRSSYLLLISTYFIMSIVEEGQSRDRGLGGCTAEKVGGTL